MSTHANPFRITVVPDVQEAAMLHAVVVGIDRYRDTKIPDLEFARRDAETLERALREGIHPAELSVRLLCDEEATMREIETTIGERLARSIEPGDIVLLYFAGHGTPETDGRIDNASRFLVAHDTEYDYVWSTGINIEKRLAEWLERLDAAEVVVLMLDACFSGSAGGRTFEGPHLKRARSKMRKDERISLRELHLGRGRVILSACNDNQTALESRELGHGIFTHCLLDALRRRPETEPTISVHVLYDQVHETVRKQSGGAQTPIINGRSEGARVPRL